MTIGRVGLGARSAERGERPAPSPSGSRRLFIAVPLPDDVRARVAAAIEEARRVVGDGPRWVRPDGLHFTLRFLGETADVHLSALGEAVVEAAATVPPFDVELGGNGAFPSATAPRAIWLGVEAGSEGLARLAASLDAALATRGWPPEARPFRPHLTLARSEDPRDGRAAVSAIGTACRGLDGRWRARTLVLFESRLGRGPAQYAPIVEAPLGG